MKKAHPSAKRKPASKPVAAQPAAPQALEYASLPPSGVLTLTVTKFRSLGAITPLEATLTDWTGFQMPPDVPMPEPAPTLTLTDDNVVICSQYPVRLSFNLPDKRYLLVGIAWDADVRPRKVGETTFPEALVQRGVNIPAPYQPGVPGGSCLTVTDNAQDPGAYNYVILIQEVSSGEIGFYDPGMDNQPGH